MARLPITLACMNAPPDAVISIVLHSSGEIFKFVLPNGWVNALSWDSVYHYNAQAGRTGSAHPVLAPICRMCLAYPTTGIRRVGGLVEVAAEAAPTACCCSIVPTLRVGMQPGTLCVTERRAFPERFPRRPWEPWENRIEVEKRISSDDGGIGDLMLWFVVENS